jgi:hypothetical protein
MLLHRGYRRHAGIFTTSLSSRTNAKEYYPIGAKRVLLFSFLQGSTLRPQGGTASLCLDTGEPDISPALGPRRRPRVLVDAKPRARMRPPGV